MIYNFELFLESTSKLKQRLKDIDYFMSDLEFFQFIPRSMPDELIKFIYSWDKKKKSPYNNTSWYNDTKGWNQTVEGGIRVSDHWNFFARDEWHCETIQDKNTIHNDKFWYVGVYKNGKYDIIKKYQKLDRKRSDFASQKIKELSINTPDNIEELQAFKKRMINGEVYAKLNNGEVQVIWRKKSKISKKAPYVWFIKYLDQNGEEVKTSDYTLLDEMFVN
jgi:hypothetical protein